MAQVKLNQVSKTYPGNVLAVAPTDLLISAGELTVLVGPSGCGKSTTLRMIAGLEEVTSGEISIGDRVVNDVEPRDRNIAMVFQSYALYPHMTVADNLSFGLRMRKHPADDVKRRVAEAAQVLGIDELLQRKPGALSGGQRQRVALGRAIVRDPAVFLFDEPLSNLDAKMRVQMRTEIARLHHRLGATMIYVTHDQTEAMTLGQRIVVMNGGFVQQVAPPLELYERPANRFVGSFIGSPAMNFLSGQIVQNDGLVLACADGETVWPLPADFSPPENLLGRELVLGVRPEHLKVGGQKPGVTASLSVLESLGNESLAYFQVAGQPITARCPGQMVAAIDDTLTLSFAAEHIQLFAADEEGVNLLNK